MSEYYILYGEKLIENDNTLEEFAQCIIDNIEVNELEGLTAEEYKDTFMDLAEGIIKDDLERTNINYQELMKKYASEIGQLLYDMENNGYDMQCVNISFFDKAKESFQFMLLQKIYFMKFGNETWLDDIEIDETLYAREYIKQEIHIDGRTIPYPIFTSTGYFAVHDRIKNVSEWTEEHVDIEELVTQIIALKQSGYLLSHTAYSCQSLSDGLFDLKHNLIKILREEYGYNFDEKWLDNYVKKER